MNSILIEMLEKLNLNKIEAQVYLNTLKLNQATAYEISRDLKTRTLIYPTLQKLIKKKLIFKTTKQNKTYYSAKNLKELLEEKRIEMDAIEKNIFYLPRNI